MEIRTSDKVTRARALADKIKIKVAGLEGDLADANETLASGYFKGTRTALSQMPTGGIYLKAVYGNGVYVAVSTSSAVYATENRNWTRSLSMGGSTTTFTDVAFGNGVFVVVSDYTDKIYQSVDGTTWSTVYSSDMELGRVYFHDKAFICFPSKGSNLSSVLVSNNGKNWTKKTVSSNGGQSITGTLTYDEYTKVFYRGYGGSLMSSTDGLSWNKKSSIFNGTNKHTSVLLAGEGNVLYFDWGYGDYETALSKDGGATWKVISTSNVLLSNTGNRGIYANKKFHIPDNYSSSDRIIVFDLDGDYVEVEIPDGADIYNVSYVNGDFIYLAHSNDNKTYYSLDGYGLSDNTGTNILVDVHAVNRTGEVMRWLHGVPETTLQSAYREGVNAYIGE